MPNPGNSQSYDKYSYVVNSPLIYIDSEGHFAILAAIVIGIVVGGFIGAGVDIALQATPQIMNGTAASLQDIHINQGEVVGAAAAGAVGGAILGVGAIFAAGSGLAMTLLGGTANVVGNQIGAQARAAFETGTPMFSEAATNVAVNNYEYGNLGKMGFDFAIGGIAGYLSSGINIGGTVANSPRILNSVPRLTSSGTAMETVAEPILNRLGNTISKPNFQTIAAQSFLEGIAAGITSPKNWSQSGFTQGADYLRNRFREAN